MPFFLQNIGKVGRSQLTGYKQSNRHISIFQNTILENEIYHKNNLSIQTKPLQALTPWHPLASKTQDTLLLNKIIFKSICCDYSLFLRLAAASLPMLLVHKDFPLSTHIPNHCSYFRHKFHQCDSHSIPPVSFHSISFQLALLS